MPASARDSALVQILAAHAALPLTSDRIEPIASLLATWTKDANALSAKMSAPKYAYLTPITGILQTVTHGDLSNEQ